jgi:hypothetical protein
MVLGISVDQEAGRGYGDMTLYFSVVYRIDCFFVLFRYFDQYIFSLY